MPIAIKASVFALFPVGEKLRFPGVAEAVLPLEPRFGDILVFQAQEGQVVGGDAPAGDGLGKARLCAGFDAQVTQGTAELGCPVNFGIPQQLVRRGKLFLTGSKP